MALDGHQAHPRVRRLSGSFHEIGVELGRGQDWSLVLAEPVEGGDLAGECERLVERLFSPAVEKLAGIAEALEVPVEALQPWYYVRGAQIGCTTFAWERPDPIIGRAYHWVHEAAKWCEGRIVSAQGRRAFSGYTHNACGLSDGLNDAGVSVLISALAPLPVQEPGLPWHALVDWVLGEAATTEDAVRILCRAPHVRPFLYFIADGAGALAVVEALPGFVRVRRPSDGVLVATNYALFRRHPAHHAERHLAAEERVRAHGPADSHAHAQALLQSHDGPFCAGRHARPGEPIADSEWYTLWAATLRPARREMHVAPGRPCETPFTPLPGTGGTSDSDA